MKRLAALSIFLALPACVTASSSPVATAPAPLPMLTAAELRDLTEAEKRVLGKMLAESLKDPDSARWKWAKFPKEPKDGTVYYCAQVNAKNSYGGYNGFKAFISVVSMDKGQIKAATIGGIQDSRAQYSSIVPDMCREKGLDPFIA